MSQTSSAIQMVIAVVLGLVAVAQLFFMFTAETSSHYATWAIACGTLFAAVGFAFVALDGDDTIETNAKS